MKNKNKKPMIGKAVKWENGKNKGQGIIRDQYKTKEGEPVYIIEAEAGKIDIVHSVYLTRFILIMIVLALGFYSYA